MIILKQPEHFMKNKLENKPEVGIYNTKDNNLSSAQCEAALESLISPELIYKFVAIHYAQDDGNDSPPSGAELEESFRSMIQQMGFRGPKVEAFIQRAMTMIDDYDYTDKLTNINQSMNSNIGRKVFGNDLDIDQDSLDQLNEISEIKSSSSLHEKRKNTNNPFFINPDPFDLLKPPSPFDKD